MTFPVPPALHPEIVRLDTIATRYFTPCGPGRIVWRRWGEGAPLVLLHGGTGSWMHWIRNIEALSQHYSVWAADLPAHGESDYPPVEIHEKMAPEESDLSDEVMRKLPTPINMATFSAIMADGIERLFPDTQVTLIGFSFGGMTAANVTARIPHKIKRLGLLGAAGISDAPITRGRLLSWRNITDPAVMYATQRHNLLVHMLKQEDSTDDLAVNVQTLNVLRSRAYLVARKVTLLSALAKAKPKLFGIWGRHDGTARGMIDLIPGMLRAFDPAAPFHVVEDAGHWVCYERPEETNRVMLDMLGAVPGPYFASMQDGLLPVGAK